MIKQSAQVGWLAGGKYFVCDAGYLVLSELLQPGLSSPIENVRRAGFICANALFPHCSINSVEILNYIETDTLPHPIVSLHSV